MIKQINAQIANEFGAAHKYLAIACFFDDLALPALTAFFEKQSDEEREHAGKFIKYLRDVNARVTLHQITKPEASWQTPLDAIQTALDSELTVTKQINDLVDLAIKENDHATRGFLNWFVSEQVEEVSTMTTLRDAAKLAGQDYLRLNAYVRHWNTEAE
ncbi:MAG: ferritin [Phycisphaerales bacterium]|nr:ferritin [Phycisphaerales bacterium]